MRQYYCALVFDACRLTPTMFGRQRSGENERPKHRRRERSTFARRQRSALQTPGILSCWGQQLQGTTEVVIDTAGAQTGCVRRYIPNVVTVSISRPQKRDLMQVDAGVQRHLVAHLISYNRRRKLLCLPVQTLHSEDPILPSTSPDKIHQPGSEVGLLKNRCSTIRSQKI